MKTLAAILLVGLCCSASASETATPIELDNSLDLQIRSMILDDTLRLQESLRTNFTLVISKPDVRLPRHVLAKQHDVTEEPSPRSRARKAESQHADSPSRSR